MIEATTPGGIGQKPIAAVIVGLLFFVVVGLSLVALGLGIGGLIQKQRRKVFAVLGIIFSVVALAMMAFVMVLGQVVS
ncbi:hypothetical protein [Zooshikella harenae]|uniref:DUF4190 domain-containing protein n=1 Tax=Zooshikella harenae TaxID=2827238 RepID=A0ABS5ZKX7_9GAMM|nr:hypothetical protein [Zooshikella harenae]MBU2713971.1 hypothetical protein [Zooshikella harenae]